MKVHLFIGAGEAPTERTKRIMDLMVEAGFSVEYEQLASKPKEGSQATILIWDEMTELSADDLSQLEALYEHPIYVAEKQRVFPPKPPLRNFDGIHPCEVKGGIPKTTQGKGPRNKWGKIK